MKKWAFLIAIGIVALPFLSFRKGTVTISSDNSSFSSDWKLIKINELLTTPPFDENDWSYPWYIVQYGENQFENTFGEDIRSEDTIKHYHTSHCYSFIEEDTVSRLKFSRAKKIGNVINIELFDESASNDERLKLAIKDFELFNAAYEIYYPFSYDSTTFNLLYQDLEINKNTYQSGDTLIGRVHCTIEETIHFSKKSKKKTSPRIKNLIGTFKVKI